MINNDLNLFLSNLNVFYRKLQNYHWNIKVVENEIDIKMHIKGADFFTIHAKLEEYYDDINEQIDEVAEHILMLGGQPLGTLKDYLDTTQIKEAQNQKVCTETVFNEILKDLKTLSENATKIKEEADNENKYTTSSLMDEYLEDYSKKTWMITQMLMK